MKIDYSAAPGFSRKETVIPALDELYKVYENPVIIEIGCIRQVSDLGAGNSTELFAWCVKNYGGTFFSCDNSEKNIQLAKKVVKKYNSEDQIIFIHKDGVEYLSEFDGTINLLYLDSMDAKPNDFNSSADHHLELFKAAESKLESGSLILIDDIYDIKTYAGKGAKVIPYLLKKKKEYELVLEGYQFLFRKI